MSRRNEPEVMPIVLAECKPGAVMLDELEALFQSQWPDFTFDGYSSELLRPVAAISDEQLVGGLAFTFYPHPNACHDALWVNALFVVSGFRGSGVARRLIANAIHEAAGQGYSELLAYTHIPDFYKRLGWRQIEAQSEPGHSVMSISLTTG